VLSVPETAIIRNKDHEMVRLLGVGRAAHQPVHLPCDRLDVNGNGLTRPQDYGDVHRLLASKVRFASNPKRYSIDRT
jgi:hypothetical protein